MTRAQILAGCQIAGYHGDRVAFARLCAEHPIGDAPAREAYQTGIAARAAGIRCGCIDCRMAPIARQLTTDTRDPTMTLHDYQRWIDEISASNLTAAGKSAALELVARQIDAAAWTGGVRDGARALARAARAAMVPGADLLAGMDELAVAGKLEAFAP